MWKGKLCCFVVACSLGLVGSSSMAVAAQEPESVTVILSDDEQKADRAAMEKKMKEASEQWDALSYKQKEDVYYLVEEQLKSEFKIINKLVELKVIAKEDAVILKATMMAKFSKLKESGDFPLPKHKCNKRNK